MNDVAIALTTLLGSSHTSLSALLEAASKIGIDRAGIEKDLAHVVAERIFMALVGRRIDNTLTYRTRKKKILRLLTENGGRLQGYARESLAGLADAIATSQVRIGEAWSERKEGINTISSSDQDKLLKRQGSRCKLCGIPLDASVRATDNRRFPGGVEPIAKPILDHAWPFYVGGNTRNLQLLCEPCNALKNDLIGVQEDGLVLSGNHLRPKGAPRRAKRVILWTLWAKSTCDMCEATSRESILWVAAKERGLTRAYGHLNVYCGLHAPEKASYIHDISHLAPLRCRISSRRKRSRDSSRR